MEELHVLATRLSWLLVQMVFKFLHLEDVCLRINLLVIFKVWLYLDKNIEHLEDRLGKINTINTPSRKDEATDNLILSDCTELHSSQHNATFLKAYMSCGSGIGNILLEFWHIQ